jgi:hypothetical protein
MMLQVLRVGQQHEVKHAEDVRHCPTDIGRIALDIGTEERVADDGQSEAHHVLGHVEVLLVAPSMAGAIGAFDHGSRIARKSFTMEGGLSQTSLAEVMFAFGREHSFAEEDF